MEILERIWEYLGLFFGGLLRGFERSLTAIFGSSNARYIKRLQAKVESIGNLEEKYAEFSNEELKLETAKFKQRLESGETLDDILIEAFALCREGGKRFLGMRHYDVQLIGGMVLHSGAIAEMITGEGKTLVATLPAYLNALAGKGVHVVTVNDYLARRDMEWMAPLYMGLGLTVGAIQNGMEVTEKQEAYACDITYGTNNEFGFDYLRDNMRPAARGDERYPKPYQQSQGQLAFAIVDEVDNILIDEARTPLIISGPAHQDVHKYAEADKIAKKLEKGKHFVVSEKDRSANLTDEGVRAAEKEAGVESFYTAGNMEWPHMIDNALKAHYLHKKDVNYVVKEGRVVIVDEFTGRLMEGRQWSDGLHQAVEAKERVKIKEETQTLATITLQNFFKLYGKVCGMTGTAMTEANEFWKIYKLDVIAIPPNKTLERIEYPDVIYCTEQEKYVAVADEIERHNKWDVVVNNDGEEFLGKVLSEDDDKVVFEPRAEEGKHKDKSDKRTFPQSEISYIERMGRPVLVGTVSIEKSERLSELLNKRGVEHNVLNAKQHQREADFVAQAGKIGAVTIATNMAGRGTDIILGGNPETMAWARLQEKYKTRLDVPSDEWDSLVKEIDEEEEMSVKGKVVKELGGLHVIGTERHDARRIDLQLRGRCGRQGDPGSSRFYLSLEDDLMRIFAGPWVKSILEKMGMQDGEKIESKLVTRRIEGAQKKVEERNFEVRKNLLEYDEVMDEQRKRVYKYRQQILDGVNCRTLTSKMIRDQVEKEVSKYLHRDYAVDSFVAFIDKQFTMEFEPRDFRGLDFKSACEYAKEEAERLAERQVRDAIDENLIGEEDEEEQNWKALTSFVNTRWDAGLREHELKSKGIDGVDDLLIGKAHEFVQRVDLSEGEERLAEDYGLRETQSWVKKQFGFDLDLEEIKGLEAPDLKNLICKKASDEYDEKESEYPVLVGLNRFAKERTALVSWAQKRFESDLQLDDVKNKQREEVRDLLLRESRANVERADESKKEAQQRVGTLFGTSENGATAAEVGNGSVQSLSRWLQDELSCELSPAEIGKLTRDEVERKVFGAVEDRFRFEIRDMERQVLLEIVDSSWKEHLLAMDHLRSSVGLAGYAQMDPKVEFKREGMRLFEEMWESIAAKVTSQILRMEQDDEFVSSTFVETSARHDEALTAGQLAAQTAIANTQDGKPRPIKNTEKRLGPNEPCHCGSGKKYKKCCRSTDRKMTAA